MLSELFTEEVLHSLASARPKSMALQERLAVLTVTSEPQPQESIGEIYRRAKRAAWDQYVRAGLQAGLIDADLQARLTGTGDDGFRSALSELMTYAFLTNELGLQVALRPTDAGRPLKVLDFQIRHDDGSIGVEVKSPHANPPANDMWSGDNAHLVEAAIDEANRQFAADRENVLVVAPLVGPNVLDGRRPFLRALYGEEKVVLTIDLATGKSIGRYSWEFFQDGRLLKLWPEEPRFTRIGAVVVLREVERESLDDHGQTEVTVFRKAMVLHNPFAPVPIRQDLWLTHPQFISDGDVMRWNDGSAIYG